MKWLFAFFSFFVVLIAVLAMAPSFFDWNQYKEPALKTVAELSGHDVSIAGDVSLAFLPSPRVYLENVSVKDPSDLNGKRELAAFERLDVRVAFLPLFKGQASVKSIRLEKPKILLSRNAAGRFNFMTPELDAMIAVKDAVGAEAGKQEGQKFSLSFDNVEISDGAFVFRDVGKDPLNVSALNIALKASSLEGPFKAKGDFILNEIPVRFDGKTGTLDAALQSTSLNAAVQIKGADIRYAGSITGGDVPEVQGEMSVSVASLAEFLGNDSEVKGGVSLSGILTANPEKVLFRNAALRLAGKDLTGAVEAVIKPISVRGQFEGQDILDLDSVLGEGHQEKATFDPAAFGGLLPQTLEIPELGSVDLMLRVPGVILKGQVIRDVGVKIQNTDKTFVASVDVGSLPGQGQMQASGALSFAEKSRNQKTGTDIYSTPVAAFEVKGQAQNLDAMVQAFAGTSDFPLIKDARRGVFDFAGKLIPSGLALNKGIINIDDAAFDVSGAWRAQKDAARSLLEAKIVADKLDFDALTAGEKQQGSEDPLAAIKALALPFDADVNLTVHRARLQGHDIKGLEFITAVRPNRIKVQKVAVQDFLGSSVEVSGGVGDLKNLSGLELALSLSSADPYKLATAFDVDTESWPKALGAVKAQLKASGDLAALDVDVSLGAFGGFFGGQGKIADPLTALKVSGLSVRVSHPNAEKAIAGFAPDAPSFASLAKPVNFDANVVMNGSVISLDTIKADLAGASISGDLKFDGGQDKPVLVGKLNIGDLVLSGSQNNNAKSASSVSEKASSQSSAEKWSSDPIDSAFLHAFELNLDVSANSVVYEDWNLSNPALKVVLQNGVLEVKDLQAGLYDGQIGATGSVSSSAAGQPLSFKTSAKIKDINMGALAKALSGTRRVEADGDVSFDFNASGKGASQKEIVSSLEGNARLDGQNVVMKGFDLAGLAQALVESNKPLPRIQQILSASTTGGETSFDTINGVYAITGGVVNITSMAMDGPAAQIVSTGRVDLPRWRMDTNHKITLKNAPDVAPFDVEIEGRLDNPANTFGSGLFDTFIRKRLADKLPDILGDSVTDKLQQFGILPQQQQPAPDQQVPANDNSASDAEAQQIKPEDVVNDLLKGFLR